MKGNMEQCRAEWCTGIPEDQVWGRGPALCATPLQSELGEVTTVSGGTITFY